MKIENTPADIKSKSLKEARDEINEILANLETKNLDLSNAENAYKRLLNLNKHVENLFKMKSKQISKSQDKKSMINKRLSKNARKVDKFLLYFLKNQKKNQ